MVSPVTNSPIVPVANNDLDLTPDLVTQNKGTVIAGPFDPIPNGLFKPEESLLLPKQESLLFPKPVNPLNEPLPKFDNAAFWQVYKGMTNYILPVNPEYKSNIPNTMDWFLNREKERKKAENTLSVGESRVVFDAKGNPLTLYGLSTTGIVVRNRFGKTATVPNGIDPRDIFLNSKPTLNEAFDLSTDLAYLSVNTPLRKLEIKNGIDPQTGAFVKFVRDPANGSIGVFQIGTSNKSLSERYGGAPGTTTPGAPLRGDLLMRGSVVGDAAFGRFVYAGRNSKGEIVVDVSASKGAPTTQYSLPGSEDVQSLRQIANVVNGFGPGSFYKGLGISSNPKDWPPLYAAFNGTTIPPLSVEADKIFTPVRSDAILFDPNYKIDLGNPIPGGSTQGGPTDVTRGTWQEDIAAGALSAPWLLPFNLAVNTSVQALEGLFGQANIEKYTGLTSQQHLEIFSDAFLNPPTTVPGQIGRGFSDLIPAIATGAIAAKGLAYLGVIKPNTAGFLLKAATGLEVVDVGTAAVKVLTGTDVIGGGFTLISAALPGPSFGRDPSIKDPTIKDPLPGTIGVTPVTGGLSKVNPLPKYNPFDIIGDTGSTTFNPGKLPDPRANWGTDNFIEPSPLPRIDITIPTTTGQIIPVSQLPTISSNQVLNPKITAEFYNRNKPGSSITLQDVDTFQLVRSPTDASKWVPLKNGVEASFEELKVPANIAGGASDPSRNFTGGKDAAQEAFVEFSLKFPQLKSIAQDTLTNGLDLPKVTDLNVPNIGGIKIMMTWVKDHPGDKLPGELLDFMKFQFGTPEFREVIGKSPTDILDFLALKVKSSEFGTNSLGFYVGYTTPEPTLKMGIPNPVNPIGAVLERVGIATKPGSVLPVDFGFSGKQRVRFKLQESLAEGGIFIGSDGNRRLNVVEVTKPDGTVVYQLAGRVHIRTGVDQELSAGLKLPWVTLGGKSRETLGGLKVTLEPGAEISKEWVDYFAKTANGPRGVLQETAAILPGSNATPFSDELQLIISSDDSKNLGKNPFMSLITGLRDPDLAVYEGRVTVSDKLTRALFPNPNLNGLFQNPLMTGDPNWTPTSGTNIGILAGNEGYLAYHSVRNTLNAKFGSDLNLSENYKIGLGDVTIGGGYRWVRDPQPDYAKLDPRYAGTIPVDDLFKATKDPAFGDLTYKIPGNNLRSSRLTQTTLSTIVQTDSYQNRMAIVTAQDGTSFKIPASVARAIAGEPMHGGDTGAINLFLKPKTEPLSTIVVMDQDAAPRAGRDFLKYETSAISASIVPGKPLPETIRNYLAQVVEDRLKAAKPLPGQGDVDKTVDLKGVIANTPNMTPAQFQQLNIELQNSGKMGTFVPTQKQIDDTRKTSDFYKLKSDTGDTSLNALGISTDFNLFDAMGNPRILIAGDTDKLSLGGKSDQKQPTRFELAEEIVNAIIGDAKMSLSDKANAVKKEFDAAVLSPEDKKKLQELIDTKLMSVFNKENNLLKLKGDVTEAKRIATESGNALGGMLATIVDGVLNSLLAKVDTTVESRQFGNGINGIAAAAQAAGMTFSEIVQLIGRGDLAAFGAVIGDIGEVFKQANLVNTAATMGAGFELAGNALNAIGRQKNDNKLIIMGTAVNGAGGVLKATQSKIEGAATVAGFKMAGNLASVLGQLGNNNGLQALGLTLNTTVDIPPLFTNFDPKTGAGRTDGSAALASAASQIAGLLLAGDAGRVVAGVGGLVSTGFQIGGNIKPGGEGSLYVTAARQLLDIVGVKLDPAVNFALGTLSTALAGGPIGWAIWGVGFLFNLFSMGSFSKTNLLADNIDADGDGFADDSASLRQDFRRGFFGGVRQTGHQILYDVNGVDVRLLQNSQLSLTPEVLGQPIQISGGNRGPSTFSATINGQRVFGDLVDDRGNFVDRGGVVYAARGGYQAKQVFFKVGYPLFGNNAAAAQLKGQKFVVIAEAVDDGLPNWYLQQPTGNFVLNINASYGAINPSTAAITTSKNWVLNPTDAASWRSFMGGDAANIGPNDPRAAAGSPLSAALDTMTAQYRGTQNDPNLYMYMDMNGDKIPDRIRIGLQTEGLRTKGDGKVQVWLLDAKRNETGTAYMANNFAEAEEIGLMSEQLLQWGAGRPDALWQGKDLGSIYVVARNSGALAAMKEINQLTATTINALFSGGNADIGAVFARLDEINKFLASPFSSADYMAANPDVATAAGGDPAKAAQHYLLYGNNEGRAINSSGLVLRKFVMRSSIEGGVLRAGETLVSAAGQFFSVFQGDGNLVVYRGSILNPGQPVWSSNTQGRASGGYVAMQADGNLVIYDASNRAQWASNTSANGVNRPFTLAMQDDGNLVVYDTKQGNEALWGVYNGRIARPEENTKLAAGWSDAVALSYIASHPDLIQAYGLDANQGRNHYNIQGVLEKRAITFDPAAYMAANPDVAAWAGGDVVKAAQHYIQYGIWADRIPAAGQAAKSVPLLWKMEKLPSVALSYIASQPDLISAFGLDSAAGVQHYRQYGATEGRQITFDPAAYMVANPDVAAWAAGDVVKAAQHYIQYGIWADRIPAAGQAAKSVPLLWKMEKLPSVALSYIASHPDLISAFGLDSAAGVQHYRQYGATEGRQITFDPAAYMAANPDVAAWAGGDVVKAAQHYIQYGFKANRPVKPGQVSLPPQPSLSTAAQPTPVAQALQGPLNGYTNVGGTLAA